MLQKSLRIGMVTILITIVLHSPFISVENVFVFPIL